MDSLESVSKRAAVAPRPSAFEVWWHAARPHTLTIAVVPVVLGTALAAAGGHSINVLVCALTLAAATLIQIGTNLHNDVGDYHRGADAVGRLGPPRPTSLGWLTPGQVRLAVSAAFACAFAIGGYLAWYGGWPILVVGILSVVSGLAYTSGPRPIAYTGLGEVFVWAFFGLVAVCGTYYLQAFGVTPAAVTAGTLVGLHAAAVLVVNNYRDLDTDQRVGKHTLAVRLGRPFSRWEYAVLMAAPYALLPVLFAQTGNGFILALPMLSAPVAIALVRRFWRESPGPVFNRILGQTAMLQVAFGMLVAVALVVGH
jgi:1,4-dihydroxy-2-naphthoate octaprenyltransferase